MREELVNKIADLVICICNDDSNEFITETHERFKEFIDYVLTKEEKEKLSRLLLEQVWKIAIQNLDEDDE